MKILLSNVIAAATKDVKDGAKVCSTADKTVFFFVLRNLHSPEIPHNMTPTDIRHIAPTSICFSGIDPSSEQLWGGKNLQRPTQ